jgi:hypothetical protein
MARSFGTSAPDGLAVEIERLAEFFGAHTVAPREIAEAGLVHAVGDKPEQAYRRSDALKKRRKLMVASEPSRRREQRRCPSQGPVGGKRRRHDTAVRGAGLTHAPC